MSALVTFRAQLQETIEQNGGHYHGDLTRSVTHLIAATTEGKKYAYAQQWGIVTVSCKWLEDSLERGLSLEESRYHPTTPLDKQGIGAWNRGSRTQSLLAKRPRETAAGDDVPRKLRRTHSARLNSQSDSMWDDIVGEGSQTKTAERSQLRPSRSMSHVQLQIEQSKSFATNTTDNDSGRLEHKPKKSEQRRSIAQDNLSKPGYLDSCVTYIAGFGEKEVKFSFIQQRTWTADSNARNRYSRMFSWGMVELLWTRFPLSTLTSHRRQSGISWFRILLKRRMCPILRCSSIQYRQ